MKQCLNFADLDIFVCFIFWHLKALVATYLENRALAKANLILQPPDNALKNIQIFIHHVI